MEKEPFRILPELATLLRPLDEVENQALEQLLLLSKNAPPELWVWNGVLVDGHNRYRLCLKHGLPFRIAEPWPDAKDLDEVKYRMRLQAISGRNMSPQEKAEHRIAIVDYKIASGKSKMEAVAETAAETKVSTRQIHRDRKRIENTSKLAHEIKSSKATSELSNKDVEYLSKTTPQQQKDIFDRAGWETDRVKEEIARSKKTVTEPFPTRSVKERKLATTPTIADARRAKMPPLAGMVSNMQASLAELNKTLNNFRKAGGGNSTEITRVIQNIDQIGKQLAEWKTDTDF